MTQAPQKPQFNFSQKNLNSPPEAPISAASQVKETPKPTLPPLLQWFYDLPIPRKLLYVLIGGQVFSIAVLLIVGALEVRNTGRQQLERQSTSELQATEINYNIKVNQMGFGFRGQSDNLAIINASWDHLNGRALTPEQKASVRGILINEIKARNIEYATLVGIDKRVIVNANNDRTGQTFDPNGLVSKVINNPEQIKVSELVSWEELQKENPPNLPLFTPNQSALIRYTVTPVFQPNSNRIIGVLVSGDVVNGKFSISEDTVREFEGGYSAIYTVDQNNPDNPFNLASALTETPERKNEPLSNKEKLNLALEKSPEIVAFRDQVGGDDFTITAQTITNNVGEDVAILVRGTPEKALNEVIAGGLRVQGQLAFLVLFLNLLVILAVGRNIGRRLESLQNSTTNFANGNFNIRAVVDGKDEVGNLADTFNFLADNIEQNESLLQLDVDQASLFQEITAAIVIDESDVDPVFNKSLEKAREILKVDRLVIYRFQEDWSGYISNESGSFDYPSALREQLNDPCIPLTLRQAYLNGRVVATEDVYNAGFHPEHEELMHRLQIKSNLVVPIVAQGKLYALLIAHHCRQHHQWEEKEIGFLSQIALRYGVILDRIFIIKNRNLAAQRAEQLKDITLTLASSVNSSQVLDIAVNEIRYALKCDRTIVYEFDEDWKGTIIAESVERGYPIALGAQIADPCFADKYVEKYQQGRVQATTDIYKAGLTECHLKQLEPFGVRANLVSPILVNRKLIGLLICHQCSKPREWEAEEIDFFSQISTQVGLSLERVKLLELQSKSEEEQRQAKELLQQRALELLMEVEPVSQGDLTIRAAVTEDEIGTIADSYNATIESLRKIVSQVQTASFEVAQTTLTNENDVNILREEITQQVENISMALETVKAMSRSSKIVAESAEQAEEALLKAQESVNTGDTAMNRTVKSIIDIRNTVQQASKQVKKLGETTENISNVVALIGRFAAQTHLLALKASIEAARAGEQGQGFAVIAEEVRALATQSAQATADIDKLVNEILGETKTVVASMEEGNELVLEGSKLVEETRQSLNQITAATVQINELVEAIAAAAFEQSENSEEVTEKMAEVAEVAEKTNASVTKLSASFVQLQEVANKLESDVSRFKVS